MSRRSSSLRAPSAGEALREVVEDHAGLRERAAAVLEHRHLAHHVDGPVCRRARLAVEIVDEARRPVGAGEGERQRRLVGVARLREAMQRVLGHARASSS
jgi:hypothetical protein